MTTNMEYDRKEHTLDVSDCEFHKESDLQAFKDVLDPALRNERLQFEKILMTQEQMDWYQSKAVEPSHYGGKPIEVKK